jgi:hypothetical protein
MPEYKGKGCEGKVKNIGCDFEPSGTYRSELAPIVAMIPEKATSTLIASASNCECEDLHDYRVDAVYAPAMSAFTTSSSILSVARSSDCHRGDRSTCDPHALSKPIIGGQSRHRAR